MKKFLSLALALLMMLPLSVGASAAKRSSDVMTADEFMNILEYWQWSNSDKDDYDDLLEYIYGSKYTREWADSCEKCGKAATYYISNGNVYCFCKKCNETYEIFVSEKKCEDCGKVDCECVDPDFSISEKEELLGMFSHKYKSCELNDVEIYQYGKNIYWYCDNCGRTGKFSASSWDDDWYDYFWDYQIRVYCSRGGSYDIDGSKYADRGDTRTITFEPNSGYVLYNVTVNGVDYGNASTLKLTVNSNIRVEAEFVKASTLKPCDLTASAVGGGTITAKKNGVKVSADEITAKFSDTVVYTFKPASSNYAVKNVTVNGRSIGKVSTYTVSNGITRDINIKVTFEWKNPYNDVSDNYLKAVEYVTEAGIMGYYNKYVNKNAFSGASLISVRSLAAALAEMADVNEKLDTVDERIEWAADNGLVDASANLSVACNVQTACAIVNDYLALLEKSADIDFEDFDDDDTAKENALSIGLVTSTTYTKNRNLTRYDLASICYLLANLDVE